MEIEIEVSIEVWSCEFHHNSSFGNVNVKTDDTFLSLRTLPISKRVTQRDSMSIADRKVLDLNPADQPGIGPNLTTRLLVTF